MHGPLQLVKDNFSTRSSVNNNEVRITSNWVKTPTLELRGVFGVDDRLLPFCVVTLNAGWFHLSGHSL